MYEGPFRFLDISVTEKGLYPLIRVLLSATADPTFAALSGINLNYKPLY